MRGRINSFLCALNLYVHIAHNVLIGKHKICFTNVKFSRCMTFTVQEIIQNPPKAYNNNASIKTKYGVYHNTLVSRCATNSFTRRNLDVISSPVAMDAWWFRQNVFDVSPGHARRDAFDRFYNTKIALYAGRVTAACTSRVRRKRFNTVGIKNKIQRKIVCHRVRISTEASCG